MEKNEIVLFESRDGAVTLPVPVRDESVWLTRMQMADLFDVTPQNITIHLKKVYAAGELEREATSKDFLRVQTEGGRQITRSVNCYNLDAIISVGYRVNSTRATQFRIWATRILKDYIVRGYAINRERMRQLGQTVEVMKRVANHTLVALTVMIAESKPQEKGLFCIIGHERRDETRRICRLSAA